MSKLRKLFIETLAVGIAQGVADGITRLGTIYAARKLDLDEERIFVTEEEEAAEVEAEEEPEEEEPVDPEESEPNG